ncbi:alpha/beta fold hydrolase [Streptomyces sp. TRM 70351]|uniref:thioesterase II family protein n=1 Tax=Streptomyces sp. TRM 70351 TaxID=3116552 RepID=UPI002E7B476D|nr:alpha/beta fold hydrolase [Streptomyces sp. TRM 70351]MEE1930136.1 alpha/beta fold hydrolase [Streptomyces sp. TRM 70351]
MPTFRSLPADCEPCVFELSGREGSGGEGHAPHFAAAFTRFLPDALSLVDRPAIIFGHSLGALFAHQLACALPADQQALVHAVIVSAHRPPRVTAEKATHPGAPFVVRTHDSLLQDLQRFGGVSAELLADADFRETAVTLLGHDLHLADTYAEPAGPAPRIPYHVWYGTDDATLDARELAGWDEACAAPVVHRGFPGGHFYPYERGESAAALGALAAEARAASGRPVP